MKNKKLLSILSVLSVSVFCLSWSFSGNKNFASFTDDEAYSMLADHYFNDPSLLAKPVAQDVLVQKIQGDNQHVLLIAFYSKDNYNGKSVALNVAGRNLVLKDDGTDGDKLSGDGLYTAKIDADAEDFKQLAVSLSKRMQKSGAAYHFENRSLVYNADAIADFNSKQFDNYQAVSISNLNSFDTSSTGILKTNSLFITDLKVIEDPKRTWNPCAQTGTLYGAWTFQNLMKQLATVNPNKPPTDKQMSDFILNWLDNWSTTQIINGDSVMKRPLLKKVITNPWLQKSADNGAPQGQLDMRFAPFRLLAIVNRFDQRGGLPGEFAGEARLIFTLISSDCTQKKAYTIAFEYAINKPNNCDSIFDWANQWYNLKNLTLGSERYNAALQKITDQFTLFGDNPNKTNQNCLNSLHVNDQALTSGLDPLAGEFRQFIVSPVTHQMVMEPVRNSPADIYNVQEDNKDVRRFAQFVNDSTATILKQGYIDIPLTYKDTPFLGGKTRIIGAQPIGQPTGNIREPFHWDGSEPRKSGGYIKSNQARHLISLNACSGCHAGETQTFFWHVQPTFYGTESTLSGFLTGTAGFGGAIDFDNNPNNDSMTVLDAQLRPVNNPAYYIYNDILRRAMDIENYVTSDCGSVLQIKNELLFKPLNMVH